ncbi:peptidyl-tRNA hydrolase [Geobacter metallireducens RCH3]|uniref:Peptidyl-tRNA hydrolase n=1 Tax=Geobacter metallireducens (strain ATCC 53774 / DSM 7210 / GS-15) TaxID=269799 RepID=PTH_GEOMG|nr:aminoacyl-tRNA hydrolase [Geobacter metallireducens]Q39RR0.1 RecName: Full=Peptidyl-tRNA hydrolase; Short=PTH [Geobacter metallireducens GS-15]ABB33064.1 peptidyl-tRNA hydrolase [Geobacter metallireducens GS-15]EHP84241.1 peptidyl-tRNA hydrolase [Geobacter metallireducens RCH3]
MATRLIIGLGNPGPKYQWTRHNAGFMVLDHLSRVMGTSVAKKSFSGLYGEGSWHGDRLLLLKPQTFMNLSGRSAAEALRFHKLTLSDLIVIHDDLDIPFGRVKLKEGGGHGGHNGLRSLMQELGGGGFVRIRIGVGRPLRGDAADYVLANFSSAEMAGLPALLDGVVDLLGELVRNGLPRTMSLYNNKDFLPAA